MEYVSRDDADHAVKFLDGKDLRGQAVTVTLSEDVSPIESMVVVLFLILDSEVDQITSAARSAETIVAEMTLSSAETTDTVMTDIVMTGIGTTSTGTLVVVDGLTLLPDVMSVQGLLEGTKKGAAAAKMVVMKGVGTKGGAMTGKRSARKKGHPGRPTVIKFGQWSFGLDFPCLGSFLVATIVFRRGSQAWHGVPLKVV